MTRLLERQADLVEFMTSGSAIFGEGRDLPVGSSLQGIDPMLLRIEAHFSYAKRMEKITAVLPKTFALLGSREPGIVRAFVESCPPTTINRLENARQFHEFLCSCWVRETPDPPYLRDVAACEIAFAAVDGDGGERGSPPAGIAHGAGRGAVRRSPAIVLLRCAHDVRPIFESDLGEAAPAQRDTPLVIAMPPGGQRPQVLEVIPPVFDLLAALDDWTDPPAAEGGFVNLLADMASRGLIEVRR